MRLSCDLFSSSLLVREEIVGGCGHYTLEGISVKAVIRVGFDRHKERFIAAIMRPCPMRRAIKFAREIRRYCRSRLQRTARTCRRHISRRSSSRRRQQRAGRSGASSRPRSRVCPLRGVLQKRSGVGRVRLKRPSVYGGAEAKRSRREIASSTRFVICR